MRHLGVCAVLAESFERIHRANLVSVGILPLTFAAGSDRKALRLTGREQFRLSGLRDGLFAQRPITLHILRENGSTDTVEIELNLETRKEIDTLRAGGLLQVLLHELASIEPGRVSL